MSIRVTAESGKQAKTPVRLNIPLPLCHPERLLSREGSGVYCPVSTPLHIRLAPGPMFLYGLRVLRG